MRTSKGLIGLVALGVVPLLAVSACGGGGSDKGSTTTGLAACADHPNDCNSGATKPGGTFTYTIEKTISGWNVNSAATNTFDIAEVMEGIYPSVFNTKPDYSVFLNTDLMVSAEQTSTSPQTLVYKIQPDAVWSDGVPISADDFIYAWKTSNGTDCPDCGAASTGGYDQIKSITPSDNGKTVTVVMSKPYTDWKYMFGLLLPAHIAQQHGDLAASFTWFDKNMPTVSGGPYLISDYQKDTSITETPNPKWYGKTKPSLDKLVFRILTKQQTEVPALENNEVQAIYPQPNADIVNAVHNIDGVESTLGAGLTWEHLDLNLQNPLLADKVLRQAIFTAVDRKALIDKTIGQFVPHPKVMNNHNFVPGQEGYKDVVTSTGAGSGDIDKAKKLLTDAGYQGVGTALKTPDGKPVNFRCSFTAGNTLRQQSCELFQSELKKLGIGLTPTPIQKLGPTLTSGDYDIIIFAWIGTPFPFAGAYQLWGSTSDSNFGHWANSQSDDLLHAAAQETDRAKAIADLNQADQIMANDYYVLPLFQKPTFLAVYSNMVNIRDNPTSVGPPYNVQEWGLRAEAQ